MERTGITVWNMDKNKPEFITHISTSHFKKSATHGQKLKHIEDCFIEITENFPPSIVAIERAFNRFPTSTAVIYKVHGVVNKLFHQFEQIYYPPKTVKLEICRGDATKKYVQDTIKKVYPDVTFNNEDESDSFAVALTYLIKNKLIEWNKVELKKTPTKKKTIKKNEVNKG
ncbi:crossover junction endodeoxyribonuclease RuvC [Paenibacillus tianjinensis]|uniref:Crossover junction endodeoxyribonuclease RuvC n=2 Tax=Paenibacillus tianjinensis TaxID=2810347 RepID=A0ABX7L7N3_9BACL|nr:crossover junction endodeoxyribonuclease RuvC [Paenibacillus tianjinensis]